MQSRKNIGTREAAEILGVDPATITRWANEDKLPSEKLPGQTGAFIFERAEVEKYRDQLAAEGADA